MVKAGQTTPCTISFHDKRWVALPDAMLQSSRHVSLYARDKKTRERIVSQEGLTAAVTRGKLELDVFVKKPEDNTAGSSGAASG